MEITTARQIGGEEGRILLKSLERAAGKRVRPQWRVDPSIIGGTSVKLGDRIIDGSIRAQLAEIRRRMTEVRPRPPRFSRQPVERSATGTARRAPNSRQDQVMVKIDGRSG